MTIGGLVESKAGRRSVAQLVSAAIPDVEIVNRLTVDARGLSRADATVLNQSVVLFDQGLSVVSYAAAPTIDAVADVLRRNSRLTLEVVGHAGPSDPVAGKRLSDERVAAVKAYLVAVGIDAGRLSTKSYVTGRRTAVDPLAEQYRRVDFIVREN
ncbi:OmpA family protein [Aeromicrobium sp. UC242_57]|uniref:OmpA family protein n=1 Tax=Aeromicrobium sp. UC242_57 TaxID=3374624 RepID=UPI0037AB60E9